ncbi:MAG: tetratricopeptide repeat protein [Chitinophagales bacterium]|nr:tetratricopeptide repeat protein [Chitinophagales bacterium]
MNNLANIARAKGDYETALDYLKKSLAIRQEIGDINGMAITWGNMGVILFEQERGEEAIPLLMGAYGIFQKIGSPNVQWVAEYLAAISKRIGEARFEEIASKIK